MISKLAILALLNITLMISMIAVADSKLYYCRTAADLTSALKTVLPGDRVQLKDGVYTGRFVINRSGAAGKEIMLNGTRNAVITSKRQSYGLHLNGANYWNINGI
jgi:hypothetical protein